MTGAVDLYSDFLVSAFCAYVPVPADLSNLHSRASLSKRNPWNTGARILAPPLCPSWVHSANLISATRSGFI